MTAKAGIFMPKYHPRYLLMRFSRETMCSSATSDSAEFKVLYRRTPVRPLASWSVRALVRSPVRAFIRSSVHPFVRSGARHSPETATPINPFSFSLSRTAIPFARWCVRQFIRSGVGACARSGVRPFAFTCCTPNAPGNHGACGAFLRSPVRTNGFRFATPPSS